MLHNGDKLSSSNSWRESSDELRKVIRDSLYRPSLMSVLSSDEKVFSSSRSLRLSASNVISSKSYREEVREESVRAKAPSLIVRLMGLDVVPLEDVQSAEKGHNSRNSENSESNTESPMSVLKFGSVKSVNVALDAPTPKPKRVTLRSLIQQEQLEGNTNSDRDTECEALSRSSDSSPSFDDSSTSLSYEKGLQMIDVATPILKFKDVHLPCSVADEVREIVAPNKIPKEKMESAKLVEGEGKFADGRDLLRKIVKDSETKFETRKAASACQRQLKKDGVDEGRKYGLSSMRNSNKKNPKELTAQFPHSKTSRQSRLLPASATDRQLVTAKSSPSTRARVLQKQNAAPQIRPSLRVSPTRTESVTPVHSARRSTDIKPTRQKNGKEMNHSSSTNQLPRKAAVSNSSGNHKQTNRSKNYNKDSLPKDKKIVYEIMPKTKKDRCYTVKNEVEVSIARRPGRARDLKELMLNSPSFLNHAYKLCRHPPRSFYEETRLKEYESDSKLYLACAQELVERKANHVALYSHPMRRGAPLRCSLEYENMSDLIYKIGESIAAIVSHGKVGNAVEKVTCIDSLYVRIEKDLRCRDGLNAMWDLSWSDGVYVEEIDRIVGQVEEHVLSMLIVELLQKLI